MLRHRRRWRLLLTLCIAAILTGAGTLHQARVGAEPPAGAAIAIEPNVAWVEPGQAFTVSIVIRSPQQPLQGVDAYVDFDPALLQAIDADGNPATHATAGPDLPVILQNRVDNALGHIDYSAGITLGTEAVTGTLTVATVRFRCLAPIAGAGTALAFSFETLGIRETIVGYQGRDVLSSHDDGVVCVRAVRLALPVVLKP